MRIATPVCALVRNDRSMGAVQRADRVVRPYKASQGVRLDGTMWASSPTHCFPIEFCRGRCPNRPKTIPRIVRRAGCPHPAETVDAENSHVPPRERGAEIGAETIRKHGFSLQHPIAQAKIFRFHHADMRKGFQNHGFWRRSLGTFFRRRKKVPRPGKERIATPVCGLVRNGRPFSARNLYFFSGAAGGTGACR